MITGGMSGKAKKSPNLTGLYEKASKFLQMNVGKDKRVQQIELAERSGVSQTAISNQINESSRISGDKLLALLEGMGAQIILPDEIAATSKEVCFVDPRISGVKELNGIEARITPPNADDFLAVPFVEQAVAAGPGLIPEHLAPEWMIVYAHALPMVSRNLCAVRVGKNQDSMIPTLHPGDILLIDKGVVQDGMMDPHPPGNIFLVQEPEPDYGLAVKRVIFERDRRSFRVVFYSENAASNPPRSFDFEKDFERDIHRAIVGRVVWSWSDMTKK